MSGAHPARGSIKHMKSNMEDWKYEKARKRVRKVKSFYKHLGTWVICSAFFIILNLITSPDEIWAIFPILGWGVGIALHGIGVFGFPGLGEGWEERMLYREIDRLEREEEEKRDTPRESVPRKSLPHASASPMDMDDDLELRELRRETRDSDFV